ncbi:serpin family protein [Sphaerochaeta halotolerans]|uniref:serpin family protein n=1 Tax=Sphaerochaeta halotolerans TaxID=2293840 RepID=UPI001368CED3
MRLSLSKFESRHQESLVSYLKTLGMQKAFTPGEANFSAMLSSGHASLHIDEMLYKSFLHLGEHLLCSHASRACRRLP